MEINCSTDRNAINSQVYSKQKYIDKIRKKCKWQCLQGNKVFLPERIYSSFVVKEFIHLKPLLE